MPASGAAFVGGPGCLLRARPPGALWLQLKPSGDFLTGEGEAAGSLSQGTSGSLLVFAIGGGVEEEGCQCGETTLSPASVPRLLPLLPILRGLLPDTGVFPGDPIRISVTFHAEVCQRLSRQLINTMEPS